MAGPAGRGKPPPAKAAKVEAAPVAAGGSELEQRLRAAQDAVAAEAREKGYAQLERVRKAAGALGHRALTLTRH